MKRFIIASVLLTISLTSHARDYILEYNHKQVINRRIGIYKYQQRGFVKGVAGFSIYNNGHFADTQPLFCLLTEKDTLRFIENKNLDPEEITLLDANTKEELYRYKTQGVLLYEPLTDKPYISRY